MQEISDLQDLRNRAAIAKRWGKPNAEVLARELRAAKLEKHIQETVAGWPPLTAEMRARLAAILAPVTTGGAA